MFCLAQVSPASFQEWTESKTRCVSLGFLGYLSNLKYLQTVYNEASVSMKFILEVSMAKVSLHNRNM